MADVTALTAIVVSGVVGPGAAALWTRGRQRADHQQEIGRELRSVLDDGAQALGDTKRAFERLFVLHSAGHQSEDAEVREAALVWRQALGKVRFAEDRIAIRVGLDHPVHRAFVACMLNLESRRHFAWAYERGEPTGEAIAQQATAHAAYPAVRRAYVEACKAVVVSGMR